MMKFINYLLMLHLKHLSKIQAKFDAQVDLRDMPSGATLPKEYQ